MSKVFITADHHFYHKNINKLCNRGFDSMEEMNEFMIDAWNSRIADKDIVYYLGDFCMGKPDLVNRIVDKLNGRISFIKGNHDKRWFGKTKHWDRVTFLEDIHVLKHKGMRFVLCHYPLVEWEGSYRGRLHLHGHCHGNLISRVRGSMDVGVDSVGYVPLDVETFYERLEGERKFPDGKKVNSITGT